MVLFSLELMKGTLKLRFDVALLYAPTTEMRMAQYGLSSKNIFRFYSSGGLSFISYKFNFFVF